MIQLGSHDSARPTVGSIPNSHVGGSDSCSTAVIKGVSARPTMHARSLFGGEWRSKKQAPRKMMIIWDHRLQAEGGGRMADG